MKIRWYHWLVYKLFHRMWNPIFKSRPDMVKFFVDYMNQWVKENG